MTKLKNNIATEHNTNVTEQMVGSLVENMQLLTRTQVNLQTAMRHLLDEVSSVRTDIKDIGAQLHKIKQRLDDLPYRM